MTVTAAPDHPHRGGHALAGDRGAVTVQAVIVAPVMLLMLAVFLHLGILLHANNLAQAAATTAYNAARAYDGTAADGRVAGLAIIQQAGSTIADGAVDVARTADTVTVTVTGTAPSFVPGLQTAIDTTVSGPTEHWTH